MKNLIVLSLAFFLSGCGAILPSEKQTNFQAAQAARINSANNTALTRQTENVLPSINVSGSSNTVSIATPPAKVTIAATNAAAAGVATDSNGTDVEKKSIPWGVKIILLAVGIGLLAIVLAMVIKYIKANSAGASAAISLADNAIAGLIQKHTSAVMVSTDPNTNAAHAAQIAELEKVRGKIQAAIP